MEKKSETLNENKLLALPRSLPSSNRGSDCHLSSFKVSLLGLPLTVLNFLSLAALTWIGVLILQSAGAVRPTAMLQGLWRAHLSAAIVGAALYWLFALLPLKRLTSSVAWPFYIVSCILLIAVLIFGSTVFGGRRWLWFFQPAELAKLSLIILLAHLLTSELKNSFSTFALLALLIVIPIALILLEPDLGTAMVLVPTTISMLLASRIWRTGLIALIALVLVAVAALLTAVYAAERAPTPQQRQAILHYVPLHNHQIKRLQVFLFPQRDILGSGYNLRQAQISIGSGSVTGKGLGKGELKALGYLPPSVSMNDFIFAVLAEELGFTGAIATLALFALLIFTTLANGFIASDPLPRLISVGVATLIFSHVYINIAMNIALMPITGLPLPFISAGRTFLITSMVALGLAQRIKE